MEERIDVELDWSLYERISGADVPSMRALVRQNLDLQLNYEEAVSDMMTLERVDRITGDTQQYVIFPLRALDLAEQSTSQQKDQQMVSIILANVGTVICFRTGNPRDEQLLLPLFAPFIEPGEISNLPAFSFYAKLSAIRPQEPMSGQTLLLESIGDEKVASRAVQLSRKTFAKKKTSGEVTQPAGANDNKSHHGKTPNVGNIELIDA